MFTGTFTMAFKYTSVNGTGTGEIVLDIATVDGIPLGKHPLFIMVGNSPALAGT